MVGENVQQKLQNCQTSFSSCVTSPQLTCTSCWRTFATKQKIKYDLHKSKMEEKVSGEDFDDGTDLKQCEEPDDEARR